MVAPRGARIKQQTQGVSRALEAGRMPLPTHAANKPDEVLRQTDADPSFRCVTPCACFRIVSEVMR